MRSPWVDLLFLHGHITPSNLIWHVEAPACDGKTESPKVDADVAKLPLPVQPRDQSTCCA